MKRDLTAYLQGLEESDMRSITDIIEFNEKHADLELPPRTRMDDHITTLITDTV